MTSPAPDIEIYVKHARVQDVHQWLQCFFVITNSSELPETELMAECKPFELRLESLKNKNTIALMVTPKAAGKAYTSLWFKTRPEVWEGDIDCAKSFLEHVDTEVRCASESWSETEDEYSEKWWKMTRDQKTLVAWG